MPLHVYPFRLLSAAVIALGLLVSGCGDDGAATTIDGAWARTSPMNAEAGAIYFTISSDGGAVITAASVPADVAGHAELHETVMAHDDTDDAAHDMGDAMMMQHVMAIDVPAGESVAFEPGGLHVMLFELPDPLELGDTFELTLEFEAGDPLTVEVEVRDEAP